MGSGDTVLVDDPGDGVLGWLGVSMVVVGSGDGDPSSDGLWGKLHPLKIGIISASDVTAAIVVIRDVFVFM